MSNIIRAVIAAAIIAAMVSWLTAKSAPTDERLPRAPLAFNSEVG